MDWEGLQVAQWLNSQGIHAFLLSYRMRGGGYERVPLSDDLAWVNIGSPELLDLNRALDAAAAAFRSLVADADSTLVIVARFLPSGLLSLFERRASAKSTESASGHAD